jgi:hypothetical protein
MNLDPVEPQLDLEDPAQEPPVPSDDVFDIIFRHPTWLTKFRRERAQRLAAMEEFTMDKAFDYQVNAVETLLTNIKQPDRRGVVLQAGTGAGKTTMAWALLLRLQREPGITGATSLFVADKSLLKTNFQKGPAHLGFDQDAIQDLLDGGRIIDIGKNHKEILDLRRKCAALPNHPEDKVVDKLVQTAIKVQKGVLPYSLDFF